MNCFFIESLVNGWKIKFIHDIVTFDDLIWIDMIWYANLYFEVRLKLQEQN